MTQHTDITVIVTESDRPMTRGDLTEILEDVVAGIPDTFTPGEILECMTEAIFHNPIHYTTILNSA
jgi:hypothetical protein